jgi:uncharacterized protein YbaP (TraB family)
MIRFGKLTVLAAAAVALVACNKAPPPAAPADAPAPAPIAAPASAPAAATAPAPIAAKPALWRIGDEDTTVYLFGAVHVLPPELSWRTQPVETALNASKAVYFETDVNPNPVAMAQMAKRLGIYRPPERLSDHLTAEQHAAVANASAKLNLPMPLLDTMKPWMAAMALSEQMIANAGYDPNSGVERTLLPMAVAAGKEIRKLETVEEQLLVFADLPEKVQINYLISGIDEIDKEPTLLGDLVSAWSKGDVEKLDKIMIEDDLEETPEVYQALLVKRNRNWTVKLDALVKSEPGVFFVAVGAGHLSGKDSVLGMLAAKGYQVERVE